MTTSTVLLAQFGTALMLAAMTKTALGGSFFERDGAAVRGYDPVAYFTEAKAVKGSPTYQVAYRGSTFRFASQANRELFERDPARYAPQYDGFCAYGTAAGYKAAIDPSAFSIVDGKLYLNYNAEVQKKWRADIPGYIKKADKNWPNVVTQTKIFE
jgi:YHS domain-containing protein